MTDKDRQRLASNRALEKRMADELRGRKRRKTTDPAKKIHYGVPHAEWKWALDTIDRLLGNLVDL